MKNGIKPLDKQTDNRIISFFLNIPRVYIVVFLCTFVFGLFCHGMMLFNKYLTYDDANYFVLVGSTYKSGRWMLGVLESCTHFLFGSYAFSIPLFNGLFTILFVAISACVIIKLFNITNKATGIVLGCVMVSTPVITTMLGYMFAAPYNAFGLLLSIVGAYLICICQKWYYVVIGIITVSCSVGVYQAFLPVSLSLILIYFIKEVWESDESKWRFFLNKALYYILMCLLFTVGYILINYLFLSLKNVQLSDYQGISKMGQESIAVYLDRLFFSYKVFINPARGAYEDGVNLASFIYPMSARVLYKVLLLFIALLSLVVLVLSFKKNKNKAIQLVALMIFIPAASNFIYVLSEPKIVYSMMLYGQVILFVYFICLSQILVSIFEEIYISRIIKIVSICLIAAFALVYLRFDNVCYLKLDVQQTREISYYTTLVTRIKSVSGYKDELSVVYINEEKLHDESLTDISELGVTTIPPFHNSIEHDLNMYSWKDCMRIWTGFSPKLDKSANFSKMEEVREMPSYPDDGSIKIVDNTVVVKF